MSLHVRNREQLFNSLDPSPFWDRDLDREAAAFIEEEFSDRPRDRPWLLNVSIGDQPDDTQSELQEAVRRYYRRLTDSVWHQTREQLRIARIGLGLGVGVFLACTVGRELIDGEGAGRLPRALDEGLIVLAWIALWLPIEQLVSDLVPLLRQRSFYGHLARLRVHVAERLPSSRRHCAKPWDRERSHPPARSSTEQRRHRHGVLKVAITP